MKFGRLAPGFHVSFSHLFVCLGDVPPPVPEAAGPAFTVPDLSVFFLILLVARGRAFFPLCLGLGVKVDVCTNRSSLWGFPPHPLFVVSPFSLFFHVLATLNPLFWGQGAPLPLPSAPRFFF